ncbi:hypothetical protein BN130_822 [Cronobacter malonaticus 507]|nr:hypothetical protein BN130_822 [Cronobacter malonaticus 507]
MVIDPAGALLAEVLLAFHPAAGRSRADIGEITQRDKLAQRHGAGLAVAGIAKDARGFAELIFLHQGFLARDSINRSKFLRAGKAIAFAWEVL